MADLQTRFRPELVDPSVFIAPGAIVVGDVTLGPNTSVWFNAVLRGDTSSIRVGDGSNIQDTAVLHADPGFPCQIGRDVTVGHAAVVHGATVEDNVLIGIRAVVLNGAQIGSGSVIAAGALVTEGQQVPPNSVVMGVPGKVVAETSEAHREQIRHAADHYVQAQSEYRAASDADS